MTPVFCDLEWVAKSIGLIPIQDPRLDPPNRIGGTNLLFCRVFVGSQNRHWIEGSGYLGYNHGWSTYPPRATYTPQKFKGLLSVKVSLNKALLNHDIIFIVATIPETNTNFAPENEWFEDESLPFFGPAYFQTLFVSFREGKSEIPTGCAMTIWMSRILTLGMCWGYFLLDQFLHLLKIIFCSKYPWRTQHIPQYLDAPQS